MNCGKQQYARKFFWFGNFHFAVLLLSLGKELKLALLVEAQRWIEQPLKTVFWNKA